MADASQQKSSVNEPVERVLDFLKGRHRFSLDYPFPPEVAYNDRLRVFDTLKEKGLEVTALGDDSTKIDGLKFKVNYQGYLHQMMELSEEDIRLDEQIREYVSTAFKKVDAQYLARFEKFIDTGEGLDDEEFRSYIENNPNGKEAVDLVFKAQIIAFGRLHKRLYPEGPPKPKKKRFWRR